MAQIELEERGLLVRAAVGTRLTVAGLRMLAAGAVADAASTSEGVFVGRVRDALTTHIVVDAALEAGDPPRAVGRCTCDAPEPCGHVVAVLLSPAAAGAPARPAPAQAWATALDALLDDPPGVADPVGEAVACAPGWDGTSGGAGLGLQVDLQPAEVGRPLRLPAHPVVRTASGAWSRTGVTWGVVGYRRAGDGPAARRQRQLLAELLALTVGDSRYAYGSGPIDLADVASRRIWDLLCELRDAGMPFVRAGRSGVRVVMHDAVSATLLVHGTAAGVRLSGAVVTEDGAPVPVTATDVGSPARAVAWWDAATDGRGRPEQVLHLAPVPAPLVGRLPALATLGADVPAEQAEPFLRNTLPRLARGVTVRTLGDVPDLRPAPPRVRLTVAPLDAGTFAARWSWAQTPGPVDPVARLHALDAVRPVLAEWSAITAAGQPVPERSGAASGQLPGDVAVRGLDAVRLVTEMLPALETRDDVDVVIDGERPRLRPAESAPEVTFRPVEQPDHDWFDLAVTVEVDGERVPFPLLFSALAHGDSHLVLPSGVYFALDDGRFADLARLIEESRALNDGPEHGVRLSRYQADAWAELERLGIVAGQAQEWLAVARAVAAAPTVVDHEPPAGLAATLRPYQRAGFGWLATLYDNGLGGVLADDMGLGKTVQTLALFCHLRESGRAAVPFLVVAPTSVVGNWAREAAQFAPDLRVATVAETAARRGGAKIGDLAAGADVVVTSYALFRIEHDQYTALDWAGLVLDEAQTVKNHTSRGYQCARTLRAPFKLAITGTPLENNLLELWALLSIAAPGLLSTPARFTDFYRTPVERERDVDRLALLRRRISPLMLRRTKEQVAPELPAKQEQILEVELAPKHRAAYQTYLQRERRKVLGLVEDLQQNRFEILKSLTVLRQAALDVRLVDPTRSAVPATKLDVLTELVDDVVAEGHRVLVFSQFTRFLTGARDRLEAAGVATLYLDGKTRRRAEVIQRFRDGRAPVFLISLKAGGTGLTLTEADYCIMLDPWWNPATENQAVDRTHRIGQTRNVMVYRLVAKDTIEEKVMALKAAKADLFTSVLDGGDFASSALSADDIRALVE